MGKQYSIFISSSDNYSDLWPLFFDLFQKYWNEYDGIIYLQTQEKEYFHHGLKIICTKVGTLKGFGRTLRAGLDKIPDENILLIMIDYIFMGKVNHEYLNTSYDFFCKNKLDSLCLKRQQYLNITEMANLDYLFITPPTPDMFSYQIAFWRKSILKEMALPHENPWMSEWYGTMRAEKMHIRLACLKNKENEPIKYDAAGCLHKGKWLINAIDFLNSIHYKFDFNKRGYYVNSVTYKSKIKIKWMIYSAGLKGSWWDLWKRKKIHQ